jgi:hypothetical protein
MVAAFGTSGGWAALTAIGTVGAVIVAVGLQLWLNYREKSRRPKLTLAFDSHQKVDEQNPAGATIPYLRVAVTNDRERNTAEDVELLVLDVQEYATSSVGSGGRNVWLANPALGWTNSLHAAPTMTIPPGATRYADVGCWIGVVPLEFHLMVVPTPGNRRHVLDAGGWRIRLAATIRNGDVTFWELNVSFEEKVQQGVSEPGNVETGVRRLSSPTG